MIEPCIMSISYIILKMITGPGVLHIPKQSWLYEYQHFDQVVQWCFVWSFVNFCLYIDVTYPKVIKMETSNKNMLAIITICVLKINTKQHPESTVIVDRELSEIKYIIIFIQ